MRDKHHKLLRSSVNNLELPVRAANVLHNANIKYIGDLCYRTAEQLMKIRNCGKKTIEDIRNELKRHDLDLGCLHSPEYLQQEVDECRAQMVRMHDSLRMMKSMYWDMIHARDNYNKAVKRFDETMKLLEDELPS
jgi:DNA-directed RNA polymerase alpha subunit